MTATFKLARTGIAHVVFDGTITALCGVTTTGETVTEGVPCSRCVDYYTEKETR